MARYRAPEAAPSARSLLKIMCTLVLSSALLSAVAIALPRGRAAQFLAFGVYAMAVVSAICFAMDGDIGGNPSSKKDKKSAKKGKIEVTPAQPLIQVVRNILQRLSAHAALMYQRITDFFRVLGMFIVPTMRDLILIVSAAIVCGAAVAVLVLLSEEMFALASAWHPAVIMYISTNLLPTIVTPCAQLVHFMSTVQTAVNGHIVPHIISAIVTIAAAAVAACNYIRYFATMVVVIVITAALLMVHHSLLRLAVVTSHHHTSTRRAHASVGTRDMDADPNSSDLGDRMDDLGNGARTSMGEVNAHVETVDGSEGPGDTRHFNPSTRRVRGGDTTGDLSADECATVWRWCRQGAAETANTTDAVTLRKLHRHLMRMGLVDPLVPTTSSADSSGGSTETRSDVDVHTGNASGSTDDDGNIGGDYANERNTHEGHTAEAPVHASMAAAARAGIQEAVQVASRLGTASTHTPATQAHVRARESSDIRRSLTSRPTHIRPLVQVHPPVLRAKLTLSNAGKCPPQHQLRPQQPRTLATIDEWIGSETPPPSQKSPQAHTPTPAPAHELVEEDQQLPQGSPQQLQAPPQTSTPAAAPTSADESSTPIHSETQAPALPHALSRSPSDARDAQPQQPQQQQQQQQQQQRHLQQQQEHVHASPLQRKPPARRPHAAARRAQPRAGPRGINPRAWTNVYQLGAKPTAPKQALVARNGGVVFADDIFSEDITTVLSDAHLQLHRHKANCLLQVVNKRASLPPLESHKEPHLVAAESFLAKGGFGAAYKCGPDQGHPHVCAVKLVKYVVHEVDGSMVTVERGLQHFDLAYQEGRMLHELGNEPNVATLQDMAHHDGCVYLRMELGTNGTLHGKRFEYKAWVYVSASLVSQSLRLGRLGILHRDVKPGNVIVCGLTPKFIDFGIAKRIQPVLLDTAGAWEMEVVNDGNWGTPEYQAPEIKAAQPYTAAADAYSLGKLLQEIRGRFTPAQDERADALIKALCQDDPNRRACTFWPIVSIFADLQTDTDWSVDIDEFLEGGFQPPVESMRASLGLP